MKINKQECEIGERTYVALKNLVLNSSEMQDNQRSNIREDIAEGSLTFNSYIKEFCTIGLKTARRSGHTTAAVRVGYEMFETVLFISKNLGMTDRLSCTFHNYILEKNIKSTRYSASNIETEEYRGERCNYNFKSFNDNFNIHSFRGIQAEAVIVDPSFGFEDKDRDNLIEILKHTSLGYDKRFLIYMG